MTVPSRKYFFPIGYIIQIGFIEIPKGFLEFSAENYFSDGK